MKVNYELYVRLLKQMNWIKLNNEKVYLDSIAYTLPNKHLKINVVHKQGIEKVVKKCERASLKLTKD
jgi:hypothetical protein